jgi:hypothetical protein
MPGQYPARPGSPAHLRPAQRTRTLQPKVYVAAELLFASNDLEQAELVIHVLRCLGKERECLSHIPK